MNGNSLIGIFEESFRVVEKHYHGHCLEIFLAELQISSSQLSSFIDEVGV